MAPQVPSRTLEVIPADIDHGRVKGDRDKEEFGRVKDASERVKDESERASEPQILDAYLFY